MRRLMPTTFLLALAWLGPVVPVHAGNPGTITWTSGYPQAGQGSGTVLVQGQATADTGYTLSGTASVQFWPVGSGVANTQTITVNSGNWSGTLTGLSSGVAYNIIVQINETNSQFQTQTLIADPATATPN